jgi:GNAT superfamily N-acetyltransferase
MALWTWWPGDALPALRGLDAFKVDRLATVEALSGLTGLCADEINKRIQGGNTCYIARLNGVPVAYGWVARSAADIGELELALHVDESNRYLWDFQTLPEWRGRGIYPLLLQAILAEEGTEGHRFWIIAAPENRASARGIEKAGFTPVAQLAFTRERGAGLLALGPCDERGGAGAAMLRLPLLDPTGDETVSPCWCCVIDAVRKSSAAACWGPSPSEKQRCDC